MGQGEVKVLGRSSAPVSKMQSAKESKKNQPRCKRNENTKLLSHTEGKAKTGTRKPSPCLFMSQSPVLSTVLPKSAKHVHAEQPCNSEEGMGKCAAGK